MRGKVTEGEVGVRSQPREEVKEAAVRSGCG